ncbi:MAG: RNA polymerase sigma factor [Acidimicrobiia bacterium]
MTLADIVVAPGRERDRYPIVPPMTPPSHDRGDRAEQFRVLFEAHYPRLLAYSLRRTRTEADAHDVVAETFTVAWRRFDELPPEDRWLPWLYGVARRVLANQRRSATRQDQVTGRLASEGLADGYRVEQSGASELVQDQLAQLRVEDQELLRLAAWEELSHDQIATVLGISVNAVGIRLHRARNRLGRRLERAGYPGVVTDENRGKDSEVGRTQTEVRDESTSDNADKEPM